MTDDMYIIHASSTEMWIMQACERLNLDVCRDSGGDYCIRTQDVLRDACGYYSVPDPVEFIREQDAYEQLLLLMNWARFQKIELPVPR